MLPDFCERAFGAIRGPLDRSNCDECSGDRMGILAIMNYKFVMLVLDDISSADFRADDDR